MRWHPIPPTEERDRPVSAEAIAAKLAKVALLGASAYVLHRQGELGNAVAQVFDAIFNPTQTPPPVPPPAPPPPRGRGKKRTGRRRAARAVPPPPPEAPSAEEEAARAAQLLGVSLAATENDVRAAFRRAVTERLRQGRGFGDQAQTSEDRAATLLLTNAKNRLVERARQQGPAR